MNLLLLAALLVAAAPAQAAAPSAATSAPMSTGGMVDLSLIEGLSAIQQPQLAGIFSFISEQDAPFAFADLLARDKKALKRYLAKLDGDLKAANGLTPWDHAVCTTLINLYASPLGAMFEKPDEKRMSKVNECLLCAVVPLQEIVARRRR